MQRPFDKRLHRIKQVATMPTLDLHFDINHTDTSKLAREMHNYHESEMQSLAKDAYALIQELQTENKRLRNRSKKSRKFSKGHVVLGTTSSNVNRD